MFAAYNSAFEWGAAIRDCFTYEQAAAIAERYGHDASWKRGYTGARPVVHFIGVAVSEYWSAIRVWGTPDFVHGRATWSCLGEIDADDIVVFGRGAFSVPKKWRKVLEAHKT